MSRAWMPFYVGDYLRDTGNLGALEHGAYLLLILHYWEHTGLPDDEEELAAICRLSMPEWKKARRRLSRFFYDGWKHKRIERELKKAVEKYEKRAAAGKKGGNASAKAKQTDSKPPSNAGSIGVAKSHQSQQTKEVDSSSRLEPYVPSAEGQREIQEVSREQVSPNDPVLQRPDDPLAEYSQAEIDNLIFEFDGLDVESLICELQPWADRKGIEPLQRKSAIYGAIKKRHGRAKLQASLKAPESVAVSPELAASRLASKNARPLRGGAKSAAEQIAELDPPEFLLRKQAQGAAA